MTEKIKKVTYKFEDCMQTTELLLADSTTQYIFVLPGDMIFVADCDYAELTRRIAAGDTESYEAYDMSDCCSYYLASEYAEEISDSLMHLIATSVAK